MVTPPGAHPGVPTVPKLIPCGELEGPGTLTEPVATLFMFCFGRSQSPQRPNPKRAAPPARPCKLRAPSSGDRRGGLWRKVCFRASLVAVKAPSS